MKLSMQELIDNLRSERNSQIEKLARADRLRAAVKEAGITHKGLARATGYSAKSVGAWLTDPNKRNHRAPPEHIVRAVEAAARGRWQSMVDSIQREACGV